MNNLTKIISIVVFSGFLFSVTFNIGFFIPFDVHLLSAMSVQDHVSTAISAIPLIILFLPLIFVQSLFHWGSVSSSVSKNIYFCKFIKVVSVLWYLVIPLGAFLFCSLPLFFIVCCLVYVLHTFATDVDLRGLFELLHDNSSKATRIFFEKVLELLVVTFFMGAAVGAAMVGAEKGSFPNTITLDGKKEKANVVRYIGSGFLAITEDKIVYVHEKGEIYISNEIKGKISTSLSCSLNIYCPKNVLMYTNL